MKKKLFFCFTLAGVFSLIILMTSTIFVQAATETWTASVSFNVKSTERVKDNSGNHKLATSTDTFQGTVNLYWDTVLHQPTNVNGCILEFLGSDGSKVCFDEFLVTGSDNKKTGKGSAIFVATGTISTAIDAEPATGIAYLFNNGKANFALDSSGNLVSFTLNGTIGGGFTTSVSDKVIIFSGTIPNTPLSK